MTRKQRTRCDLIEQEIELALNPGAFISYDACFSFVSDLYCGWIEARQASEADPCGKPVRGFNESFRTAMAFLANLWKLWVFDALEGKRAMLKLTFSDRLAWVRGEGFRTAETTLPVKVLGGFKGGEKMTLGSWTSG